MLRDIYFKVVMVDCSVSKGKIAAAERCEFYRRKDYII